MVGVDLLIWSLGYKMAIRLYMGVSRCVLFESGEGRERENV